MPKVRVQFDVILRSWDLCIRKYMIRISNHQYNCYMKLNEIYYCRECRVSHHLKIKDLKNNFLENPDRIRSTMRGADLGVLEDYAFKNRIKKPEHIVRLSRMATQISKEWKKGRVISVSFMGGKKTVKDRLVRHAERWSDFANIQFDFKDRKKPGEIRIAFRDDGSWSNLGTDALSVPVKTATMNFGWLTPRLDDEEYSRVVLHEFGHALGCIHEHERPDNGIPWNKEKVYEYYADSDGWTREEVDDQVFTLYNRNSIRSGEVDKKSIMMYAVPNVLTNGNYSIGWNTDFSPQDKKFIRKLYPA